MSKDATPLLPYIIRRILQGIPLFFGVIVLNFTIIHLAPGNPVHMMAGELGATPEYIDMLTQYYGLDKPLHVQLFIYLSKILQGDFGYSMYQLRPVTEVILDAIPTTLLLVGTAIIMSSILGIILGVISSLKQYSIIDNIITVLSLTGWSIPIFWLGQMLIIIFSIQFNLFPAQGMMSLRTELHGVAKYIDILWHLILPSTSLGAFYLALIVRITRGSMLEVLREDFITMARSVGLSEKTVIFSHALKNALLPVVTVIFMRIGFIFTGALLTETVFSWPGIGGLTYSAMMARDYPTMMGVFILVSVTVITINLLTDIVYAIIDPRIRMQ